MSVASTFVSDEFTIRPVTPEDIEEWKKDSKYEGYAFAEAVIEKFKHCYILWIIIMGELFFIIRTEKGLESVSC